MFNNLYGKINNNKYIIIVIIIAIIVVITVVSYNTKDNFTLAPILDEGRKMYNNAINNEYYTQPDTVARGADKLSVIDDRWAGWN